MAIFDYVQLRSYANRVTLERLWPFLLLANKRINVLDDLKAINVCVCIIFFVSFSFWALSLCKIVSHPTLKNSLAFFILWRSETRNKKWMVERLKSNHHPWNGIQIWKQAPFLLHKSRRFVCQHLIWFLLKCNKNNGKTLIQLQLMAIARIIDALGKMFT